MKTAPTPPTFTIDELRLTLPPGFEHRSESIARLVARELSQLPVTASARLATLAVPQVAVHSGHDDAFVAAKIARAVASAIPGQNGGSSC